MKHRRNIEEVSKKHRRNVEAGKKQTRSDPEEIGLKKGLPDVWSGALKRRKKYFFKKPGKKAISIVRVLF
jgi:hypothetical protein